MIADVGKYHENNLKEISEWPLKPLGATQLFTTPRINLLHNLLQRAENSISNSERGLEKEKALIEKEIVILARNLGFLEKRQFKRQLLDLA